MLCTLQKMLQSSYCRCLCRCNCRRSLNSWESDIRHRNGTGTGVVGLSGCRLSVVGWLSVVGCRVVGCRLLVVGCCLLVAGCWLLLLLLLLFVVVVVVVVVVGWLVGWLVGCWLVGWLVCLFVCLFACLLFLGGSASRI